MRKMLTKLKQTFKKVYMVIIELIFRFLLLYVKNKLNLLNKLDLKSISEFLHFLMRGKVYFC